METLTAESMKRIYAEAVEEALKRRLPSMPAGDMEALLGELVAMPARVGLTSRRVRRRVGKIRPETIPIAADPRLERLAGVLSALEVLEAAGLEERLAGVAGAGLRAARALAEQLEKEALA